MTGGVFDRRRETPVICSKRIRFRLGTHRPSTQGAAACYSGDTVEWSPLKDAEANVSLCAGGTFTVDATRVGGSGRA